jgi:nucleotide-binding universal stress UspA family protein
VGARRDDDFGDGPRNPDSSEEARTVILIAYDGSVDADAAIERAGALLRDEEATVLTVWEPIVDILARTGGAFGAGDIDYVGIDRASEEQASERADAGAELARRAGLKAQGRARVRDSSTADTILAAADDIGADAILMGMRGLGRFKSLLLGSVSHGVLQGADRPVIVVPSPDVAAERAAQRS